MRWTLYPLVSIALLTACGETPSLAPTDGSDLARGGAARPAAGSSTIVDLGFTLANDIDEYGRIVGWDQSKVPTRAFLWTPATRRGTTGSANALPGISGSDTYATGI